MGQLRLQRLKARLGSLTPGRVSHKRGKVIATLRAYFSEGELRRKRRTVFPRAEKKQENVVAGHEGVQRKSDRKRNKRPQNGHAQAEQRRRQRKMERST